MRAKPEILRSRPSSDKLVPILAPTQPFVCISFILRQVFGGEFQTPTRCLICGRNYNYGPAGEALGIDILKRPFLVSLDPVLAFKAALWFWNTPREGGIPSIHNVIIGKYKRTRADKAANRQVGFGYTINIINGGIECGKETATPQAANRVKYFQEFCQKLRVSPGRNLDCTNQKSFA